MLIPETYRQLRRWLTLIVRIFFRRVEVVGLENLPIDRGGILVAWHPNGLVDPALILTCFPHHVVFGARHTLFKYPLLGRFVRALGTVPIYRGQDTASDAVDEQRRRNDASLDALAQRIAAGSFSALFPEGYSHDTPYLRELKTGAARLYYRARASTAPDRPTPVIVPVGLHYDHKKLFRSSVLVVFHPPLELPAEIDITPSLDEDPDRMRDLARNLTDLIDKTLRAIIFEVESWELQRLLHRARKLVRAERASRAGAFPGESTMDERVIGLARVWTAYKQRAAANPAEVAVLRKRIERYDRDLRTLKIDDHEIDDPPPIGPWFWLTLALQVIAVVFILPPLLLIGAIVNVPPAALVLLFARLVGREHKDMASLKLVAGIILFPLTWAVWGWLAFRGTISTQSIFSWMPSGGMPAAVLMVLLSVIGAVVLLRYFVLAVAVWRAVRVRLTRGRRARSLIRLKLERARLCDELVAMTRDIALPGRVAPDGRVVRVP